MKSKEDMVLLGVKPFQSKREAIKTSESCCDYLRRGKCDYRHEYSGLRHILQRDICSKSGGFFWHLLLYFLKPIASKSRIIKEISEIMRKRSKYLSKGRFTHCDLSRGFLILGHVK